MSKDWGRSNIPELSIIVPCFNEAGNLVMLKERLLAALHGISFECICVDDCSTDATPEVLSKLENDSTQAARFRSLRLLRNAGQQACLRAGLQEARGALVAMMDADLQHPPEQLPEMIQIARDGCDIVQMVRDSAQSGLLKNLTSVWFYRLFQSLSETPPIPGGSDFRLITRAVADVLVRLPERSLVFRAIIPQLGFRTITVPYKIGNRHSGVPAYTLRKSWRLFSDTVFWYSDLPLKLMMRIGAAVAGLSFLYGIFNIASRLFTDWNVPGYTDIVASVLFLGGLTLLFLGVIARYQLQILNHLRGRPEWIVSPKGVAESTALQNRLDEKSFSQ